MFSDETEGLGRARGRENSGLRAIESLGPCRLMYVILGRKTLNADYYAMEYLSKLGSLIRMTGLEEVFYLN